jgi:hypothetical protein
VQLGGLLELPEELEELEVQLTELAEEDRKKEESMRLILGGNHAGFGAVSQVKCGGT